ncbi:uncharacterized protein LOC110459490 isoform X2 [Mizuhopecten yessoensis]|uniref:uncharacterized protein LOC110459490 isoform X2 n=1 Tax=Mizuhopecten yessoensis TaxID=6573 RepID=UPI000B45C8C6|nr:uncharacterized protein LOC110459490 isoform X2 [Mizuhopecten yessoensis]
MEAPEGDRKEVRRPMNAFLIFCKRHRTMVREKNPHLDNRSVTRILGDLWANLQEEEKSQYTDLAKQYKDAFMKANPDYKWHNPDRLTHCPTGKPLTRPSNIRLGRDESELSLEGSITPGKLADPSNMGGLSNLLVDKPPYSDSHKLTSAAKSATTGTPQASVTSLMDLAMMCSSELSDDQLMSDHHGNIVDHSNKILDLTTKEENCIDMEEVRSFNGSGESNDSEKGWSNNSDRESKGGLDSSGDKMVGKCEDGVDNRTSGKVMVENLIDKLYTGSGVQSRPSNNVGNRDTGSSKTEVPGLVTSSPADVTGLSGTRPKGSSIGAQHIPGLASFLMNKSTKYNVNDELVRGENYGGRKRCYSETSVDIYADHRKLHRILKDNGAEENIELQPASLDQEFGEGEVTEDGMHPVRKSKRRNRGQRYQELINEGIIQPSKERMAVIKGGTNSSHNEQDSSEEEVVPRPLGDLGFDVLSVYPRQIRKRTCSESEKTRSLQEDIQRYKTGDFDLEAHIATLPACSLEKVSRNSKRPAGKVRSMSESCGRSSGVAPVPEVVLTVPPHLKQNKQAEPVTGSQRRKARKHSVTHLQLVRPAQNTYEKIKVEVSNTVKKTEASLIQAEPGDRPTPNSNFDPKLDVIKSDMSETTDQKQSINTDAGQRSVDKFSENTNTLNGNTLSACNMIDNILVSLVDRKDAASGNVVDSSCGTVHCPIDSQENYIELLCNSAAVSAPTQQISTDSAVNLLTSQMIGLENAAFPLSPQITSMDTSPSLTKSDLSGFECGLEGFTSLKTPTAGKGEQKSLCILSTEANITPVSSVVSTTTDITMRNNSPQFDNSSSDEKTKDLLKDSGDVQSVHTSITMATSSPAGGSFISEVPCVTGQEYLVTPPQQVAAVNS